MSRFKKKVTVLPYEEWNILFGMMMKWPEGERLSLLDQRVHVLLDLKLIEQKGHLYHLTEAGVEHMTPRRIREATRQALLAKA